MVDPELGAVLQSQLALIEPSVTLFGDYAFPCAAMLKDGTLLNCVYFVPATVFRRRSGSDRPSGPGVLWVSLQDVASIHQSPARLPARFANELYKTGESGMDYYVFTVQFSWWRSCEYVTPYVDFIDYPQGKGPLDIRRVLPHVGNRKVAPPKSQLKIYWCVFASSASMEPEQST